MVSIEDGIIQIHTKDTSLVLSARRAGLLENVYYGARIHIETPEPLLAKVDAGYGGDILRGPGQVALSSLCLELSPQNRGDYRRAALVAQMAHGAETSDYRFETATLQKGPAPAGGMPQAHGGDEVLAVSFSEPSGLEVELFYTVFYEANVITKKMRITNRGAAPVRLTRALSNQLDLPRHDFDLFTLTGAWAREFQLTRRPLAPGILRLGNGTGASGNRCNPFFFLAQHGATEAAGDVYGFNLVYSGSHEGTVEVDSHGRTRVLHGLWCDAFSWPLAPGEGFITPEAVMTFSDAGKTGMSHNMHRFVQKHILPAYWQHRPRPVLVNNWEGTYFNFTEAKLLRMARVAAKLGVELFVLDDGWFGRRNNDKGGLGDYNVNRKKLPSGLAGLAAKLGGLGLQFGLWFEPEMVSADSALYEQHPDWVVHTPGYEPCTGRQQYVLDLCRAEVREYIIRSMGEVLDGAAIRYVKWDMNRHVADNYSPGLADQGEFQHRFTLGLYEILEAVCATRPQVLFEGCSSGGNRFDLGTLCFMPQIWVSDDSDAHERQRIQTGASYGYPQCTMGCHVSAVPNHQTLRRPPLDTRFNTAVFGLLGYELDMARLTKTERGDIAAQIAFYKQHRMLLQFGEFYRLRNPFYEDGCRWMVTSQNKTQAMVGDFMNLLVPNSAQPPMRLAGLAAERLYKIAVRRQKISIDTFGGLVNFILPVHVNPEGALVKTANKLYRLDTEKEEYVAYGDLLCKAGVNRAQDFSGAGYGDPMRFMTDFASRLYTVQAVEKVQKAAAGVVGEAEE